MVYDTEVEDVEDHCVLDSVNSYFRQIRDYPVLLRKKELELVQRYKETGDRKYGNKVICANLRIAAKWALEFRRRVHPSKLLDLIQESNTGLVVALEKFDPEAGNRFSTFAKNDCYLRIRSFIRDNQSQVKLGTTADQRRIYSGIFRAKSALYKKGIEPTSENLAPLLGVSSEAISEMEQRLKGDVSLQSPIPGQDGAIFEDFISDPNAVVREDQLSVHQQNINSLLERIINSLSFDDRERDLFEQRTYCRNGRPLTLQEFGDKWSLSKEGARQLEVKLLARFEQQLSVLIDNEPYLKDLFND